MEDKLNKSKEVITGKLNVPKEVALSIPKIIIVGNEEITIENHKGIKTFDEDKIRIKTNIGIIKIEGKSFEISYIGGDTITVTGVFKSILYEGKEK